MAVTDTVKTLEAHYSGIGVVVDGKAVTPKDAAGNTVEPFIVDGTTYLPVRAVAEALGQDVAWDGETRTVYIGEVPGAEVNWMQKLPPYMTKNSVWTKTTVYDGSDYLKYFTVAGEQHTEGIVFTGFSSLYDENSVGYAIWNTNGLYKAMDFTVCATTSKDIIMEIDLNGENVSHYDIKWDDPPQTFTIPLNYASNIKVGFKTDNYEESSCAMYDISFAE